MASLAIGCTGEDEVDCGGRFRVQDGFSHQEWISTAVSKWNEFAGYEAIVLDQSAACVIREGLITKSAFGTFTHNTGEIMIDTGKVLPRKDADSIGWSILAHEIGHSFGMDHGPDGIMGTKSNHEFRFSHADLEQCLSLGVCNEHTALE